MPPAISNARHWFLKLFRLSSLRDRAASRLAPVGLQSGLGGDPFGIEASLARRKQLRRQGFARIYQVRR